MTAGDTSQLGELAAEHVRGAAFEAAGELGQRHVRRMGDEEVDVIALAGELDQLAVERVEHPSRSVLPPRQHGCGERLPSVLHAEQEMQVQQVDAMSAVARDGSDQGIVAGRRYRLQLTRAQERQAGRIAGCCRAVWNAALEQRRVAWRMSGRRVWALEQMAELPDLKRGEGLGWLREDGIAQSLQQTLRDLDVAYRRYFAGLSERPRFKRKGRGESFRLPQGRDLAVHKLNRRWAEVRIPKLGWCRFRLARPLGGQIRHATVSRDALGWHISFCVALDQEPAERNGGPAVGVDRGIAATVALSTGELRRCLDLRVGQADRLRRLRRKAGRQETARRHRANDQRRRSARAQRTLDAIARVCARETRIRNDFLHKLSTELATWHSLIAIENLQVKNMTRSAKGTLAQPGTGVAQKRGLNRSILAQGWGELHRQLAYKTGWYGSRLAVVPAACTSQTCSACGAVDARSRESQARFRCVACGHIENADVNAARVILARAADGHEDGGRIRPLLRGEPSRREPGPRTANHPAERAA